MCGLSMDLDVKYHHIKREMKRAFVGQKLRRERLFNQKYIKKYFIP